MDSFLFPFIFFVISFLYSSVGLGGGSSYTAIMVISGISFKVIPIASLSLNVVVTFLGMINYWRRGFGKLMLILPLLFSSIPMAYYAGKLDLPEFYFKLILLLTLLLILIRIYFVKNLKINFRLTNLQKWILSLFTGAILGFVAGTIGIGGGVFLVPLIIVFGLASEKEAAASGSVFIWMNSLSGLVSRMKHQTLDISFILPLLIAVIFGGFAGSYLGASYFEADTIQKILGVVILIAVVILLRDIL